MNKSKVLRIFIMFMIIMIGNIGFSNANSEYPKLDTIDGLYVINQNVYEQNNNFWCIANQSNLTHYHTCLYKKTTSGTIDLNNSANENQIAFALGAKANENKGVSTSKVGSLSESEMQLLAQKVGLGGNGCTNSSADITKYTKFSKVLAKMKEMNGKTETLSATNNGDGTYTSEEFSKFVGYKLLEGFNAPTVTKTTSGADSIEVVDASGNATTLLNANGSDNSSGPVKFKVTNPKEGENPKIEYTITFDSFPTKVEYQKIELSDCPNYSAVAAGTYDMSNNHSNHSGFAAPREGERDWSFVPDKHLSLVKEKTVHNCYAHYYLFKNVAGLTGTTNQQPLIMVRIEEGKLEIKFTIEIQLEDTPTTTITVVKNWTGSLESGNSYPDITVTLYNSNDGSKVTKDADGKPIENPVTLNNGNSWTYKWENLPKKDKNGKTIKYKVEESETSGTIGSGDTAQEWKAEKSSAEGTSGTLTLKNKVEPPPKPTPTPTPSDDEDVKITKTVEYVLSEYEGDTSGQDVDKDKKNARVQTGDQVVFKIVVESLRKDEPEDTEKGEAGNWEDNEESTYGISGKPKEGNIQYCNISCHEGEKRTSWEEYAYKDSGNCAECGNPLGVRQVKSYGFKSLKLEDVLEDESKVKIKSIFDGTYDHGSVSGFTKPEGTWSMSGNIFTWDSGIGEEESGKKSATLYILCDVSEDWKYDDGKGNECVNTATLKHVDWRITKTRWYHWQQETTPFTSNHVQTNPHYHYKYVTCTTCRGSGSVSTRQTCQYCYGSGWRGNNKCRFCGGQGGFNSSQPCSNCGGSGQVRVIERTDTLCKGESAKKGSTTKKCNKTSLPTKYEDEGKDYDISDTAKVILQGYKEAVEKKLTKIQSKYETEITGDDLKDELVQIGDVLTYTIRIKNEGETNIYTEFELEDELIDGLDTDDSKVDNSIWNGSDPTYTTTSVDGKNDSVQNGGRYIGNGEESEDVLFMAHVIGKPGERTENHVQLNYFHNRNKVKIESDAEATAENDIDTYSISVNKYITKVQSRQENSVAGSDGSGLVDLGDSRKTNKGEAVIVDRGDIVTFKIEITDDHDNTNIWKVELKDVYNPEELALKEYRSEDGLFEVNGSGGNINLIYNNSPKNQPNTSNPHLEAGGGVRSVEIDFVAIEGAELLKKDDVYENKVNIEKAFNRNHIEILQYSSTGGTHESSDKCTVRQINAVIDKYVTKVFGGIEGDVSSREIPCINAGTENLVESRRKRLDDTYSAWGEIESKKFENSVTVERGDEITYTLTVKNTGEGIITKMNFEDVFDKYLIFKKCQVVTKDNKIKEIEKNIYVDSDTGKWTRSEETKSPDDENKISLKYDGLLKPGEVETLQFIFVMTEEPDDLTELYGISRKFVNTFSTLEIQNINAWTWNNDGGSNKPYDTVIDNYNKNQCYLNLLQNGYAGIPSNMWSSDYVYMLSYQVELDKYIINVEHQDDVGTTENYNYASEIAWVKNKGNGEETKDGTNREFLNNFEEDYYNNSKTQAKGLYKENYPVQVEKNDIVTYEIKIKNTGDRTSIYSLDLVDVFSAEDGIDINGAKNGTANVGIELLEEETKSENNGQVEIVNKDSNTYLFEFTPKDQCANNNKTLSVNGYGIGSGEEATFRIVVKVTRSNMYLYELRNTAIITNVYNRNNNIGTYQYSSSDTGRSVEDAYRVTNGNRAYISIGYDYVEPLTLNGLEYVYGNRTEQIDGSDKKSGIYLNDKNIGNKEDEKHIIRVGNKIADADYINLKDLIISGYVWDDTDPNNDEDGLMTWGANGSNDAEVEGDVWAYLYRVEPNSVENYPEESTLVMKTKIDKNGYYIFGTPGDNTKVYSEDNGNRVTVNQKYRFEPINYKTPKIKVNGTETKDTQTKEIYENNFTNYRIVKAPNKDYNEGENQDGSTTRYDINKYHGYYQYYVEFEYNGMKYTHTVYGSDTTLEKNKVKGETENRTKTNSNQDGQYNLITNGRATRLSENWLPYRTSTKDNSEYYEIDSNAAEFKSVREAFNNQFETVAYNKGIDPNANDTPLSYTTETDNSHVSRYNYTDEVKIRARSFITEWIDKVGPEETDTNKTYRNDSYKTFSATVGKFTNTLFFWDKHNTTRNPGYENIVGTTEETEYLKYINLGLKQRPIVDLELIKDVYNVQVDINDKTMVYEYNCVTPENLGRSDEDKTTEKYYTTGYKLYLYKSDYYYRYKNYSNEKVRTYKKGIEPENSELNPNVIDAGNEGDWLTSLGFTLENEKSESELNIQITYKYTITNKSGMPIDNGNELIIGSINEIVDYHSADLIPNKTGRFVKQLKYPELENEKLNLVKEGTVYVATQYGAKKEEEKEKEKGLYKTINNIEGKTNDNFHTVYLSGFDGVKLYPKDSLDIYLTFTVSRTAFEFENTTENLKEAIKIGTKDNVAEISAFSTWYDSDSKYITNWSKNLETPGLIDKDSNPGDKAIDTISEAKFYGDDTYKVDIGLELYGDDTGNKNGERLIDGLVWEDVKVNDKGVYFKNNPAKIIYETMQVVSDGLYHNTRKQANSPELDKDNDKTIDGMDVELIEIISDGDNVYEDRAEIYDENGNKISNLATTTNNVGEYKLYTYIPGNYVVRFKYGNKEAIVDAGYNGQDYKSTTYQVNIGENSYYAQTYDGYNGEEYTYVGNLWHDLLSEDVNGTVGGKSYCDGKNNLGQKCSMNDENCTDHISDARDDEVRRLEVTAYSRTINNKNAEILNGQKNKDELIKQTNMFADTAKLQVEIEHLKYVKGNNKQELETSKYDNRVIKQTEYYIENELNIDGNNVSIVKEDENKMLVRDNNSNKIKIDGIMIPYYIGNIDFGLEARPTTNISLTKLVSGIRVETADGEEILDVEYEPQYSEDGTLLLNENGVPTVENSVTTGAEHMQALNSSTTDIWGNTTDRNAENQNGEKTNVVKQMYRNLKTTQGFYYINIDEDLMQGAVITLRYSIVVANESEVDTLGMLTGFGNGEQIYDEVLRILSNKDSEYIKDKANNELPGYNGNKINKDKNQGMKYGYYTGATYYNGKYHPETYVVETRIDQIIDYVDNNLNVREEDNSTKDSSWRTVSLKELVEGEIQKDIVGQNWTENADHKTLNNTYSKTLSVIKSNENEETLKYVAYGSNGIKTIEVNNVGNMLSDKVYRKVFEENVEDKDLENELKNASVTGSITVNKDNDKIKDSTGKSVTILDSNAREYITEQRNNILLSIPEADKNPDLYKYLIPAKALTAKPENEDLTININKDMIDQNKVSSQIRIAMEYLIDKYNDKNSKFSKNLEGLKNCLDVNVYSELPEEYDQQIYEIARGKILELAQNTIEDKLSKYVYGTQNGSRFLENDNKYEKINGETSAKIKITATRTISPESTAEEREDLTFENLAEILQFSNEAGRRDEFATVGDAQVWEGAWKASTGYTPQGGIPEDSIDGGEDGGNTETNESVTKTKTKERYDTDTTEMVLLSPPTGLSQRELVELGTVKTQNNILLISVLTLTMLGTIIVVIKISNRKKFYR